MAVALMWVIQWILRTPAKKEVNDITVNFSELTYFHSATLSFINLFLILDASVFKTKSLQCCYLRQLSRCGILLRIEPVVSCCLHTVTDPLFL